MNHFLSNHAFSRAKYFMSFALAFVLTFEAVGPGVIFIKEALAVTTDSELVTAVAPCIAQRDTLYSNTNTKGDNPDGRTEGPAKILTTIHPAWTADVDGPDNLAQWIWTENPVTLADTQTDTTKNFYKQFNLPATTTEAHINIATDNFYKVWVNGVLAGSEQTNPDNFTLATQDTIDITNLLVSGSNLLKIEVTNKGVPGSDPASNPAGLMYALSYTIDTCGGGGGTGTPSAGVSSLVLAKFLDGKIASSSNTFAIHGTMTWGVGESFDGDIILESPFGFRKETRDFANGSNTMSFVENTGGVTGVLPYGAPCQPGKYRVVGYTYGATYADAMNSSATTTSGITLPANLTSRMYVIVWNETCPASVPPVTSTVNLCVQDEFTNPLSGWQLSLATTSSTLNATTTANGCTSLVGVPFGSYTLDQSLQSGWSNVSGTGLVTVASTSETFTIVNSQATTTVGITCVSNCSSGTGGGGSGSTPTGLTAGLSGGGGTGGGTNGGGGEVLGVFTSADPQGEVLGAYTEVPGIPNTGLGPQTAKEKTFNVVLTLTLGLLTLSLFNYIALKKEIFA